VYKLEELDRRFRLLRPGATVLDLGCRPGSWLQFAAKRVGPSGFVVGLDRQPLDTPPPARTHAVVGDVFDVAAGVLRGDRAGFDVVLSDMAPDTTGIRVTDQARSEALAERALELADQVLLPGGHAAIKVFQGPGLTALRDRARGMFDRVELAKPLASRKQSSEVYLVGIKRR
jgi:23S rRNA (uridine2552-2'-O)-methyltransferase